MNGKWLGMWTVLALAGCSGQRVASTTTLSPSTTNLATRTTTTAAPSATSTQSSFVTVTSSPVGEPSTTGVSTTVDGSTTVPSSSTTTPPPAPVVLPVVSRVATNDPVVFFTIDDGIVRDPAVVDFLRTNHIPVTLFVNPVYVQKDPAFFRSIAQLGNTVQDHTVTHPHLTSLSFAGQQAEICGPLDGFTTLFGQRPWLLRPPYGAYNVATFAAAAGCGIRYIVTWHDTMNNGQLATWGTPLHRGDIVLMHFRTDLLLNLRTVLQIASASGLHPASLTDYLPHA